MRGFDEVMPGAIIVVATNLTGVSGLEAVEDIVEEVEDLDGGLVGERRQRWRGKGVVLAHGSCVRVGQRAAVLRREVEDSGGAKTSR